MDEIRNHYDSPLTEFDPYYPESTEVEGGEGTGETYPEDHYVGEEGGSSETTSRQDDQTVQELEALSQETENQGADAIASIKALIDKIQANANIPDTQKSALIAKLERAKSSLELNGSEAEKAKAIEVVEQVKAEVEGLAAQPKAAIELAAKLNKPVDEVMGAFQEAGFNPDQPDPEKAMKALESLGALEDLKTKYSEISKTRKETVAGIKERFASEVAGWKGNSENPPAKDIAQRSYMYFKKEDPEYQQMMDVVKQMQTKGADLLNSMGLKAAAGMEPDQLTVNGTIYDFINEDSGEITLSTTQTDFTIRPEDYQAAPKNTEMTGPWDGGDKREGVNNKWFQDHAPDGYPKETFDAG